MFDVIKAILLGVVEGLTEFLPVSSTGHLLLVDHFFGPEPDKQAFWDSFNVLIQFGAILALLSIYFARLWKIAFGMIPENSTRAPDDPGLDRITRAAAKNDLPVNLLCWANLDNGTKLIDRHPDTRFIIDHLGILQPRTPPAPEKPWADLPKVLELAKRKNCVIKVSGACTLSKEPYPYNDIWDPLQRIFDAWGFERCLWGTDWTRAFAVVNYEQGVKPFLETKRLSDSERAMIESVFAT